MKTTNKKRYKSMEKEKNMGERSHLFEIRRLPRSAHAGNLAQNPQPSKMPSFEHVLPYQGVQVSSFPDFGLSEKLSTYQSVNACNLTY